MSANLQPISSDGGFVTAGNIEVSITTASISSPAPYINGFSSINTTLGGNLGGFNFNANGIAFMPGETTFRSNNDIIMLQSYDTPNNIGRNMRLGTDGALYLEQTGLIPLNNRTWLRINPNLGNVEITGSIGVVGSTEGGDLSITGGAAEQSTYNTGSGGNVNITGGLGAGDDGGGGGPGGSINITSGLSADPAGHAGNVKINTGGSNTWTFDYTGNLTLPGNSFTVNYANGTQVSIGGGGSSYGNSDVVTLLGSFGSNTISTTGNISGGNVLSSGYGRFTGSFDESQASTAGLYLGYAGGTSRMMFGTGNTLQTFEIDNDGGNLRFYQPGSTKATLTPSGNLILAGNISATNIGNIASANFDGNSSNVLLGNGVFSSQGSLRTLVVADTLVNTNSGSPLQLTSSMYRILINAGTASTYTFTLPDTNTCYIGQSFVLASAQAVTQNYNYTIALFGGGSSGQSWTAGTSIVATCVAQRGGSAEVTTNWKYSYQGAVAVSGTGAQVMSVSPSIGGATLTGNINASGGALNTSQVGELCATWSYGVNNTTTAVPTAVSASGVFTIPSTAGLSMGQPVTITGTLGGTGTISGYTTGTTYYIIGSVTIGGATSITLSPARNSASAVTTTAGTLSGLTMTFGAAVGVYSYTTGTIVNITGTIGANFDVNINNIFTSGYAYNVTLVINQGATPYVPANVYLGQLNGYSGTAQTIRWAGGVTPTGTANAKDVITLSWIPSSGYAASLMLGQLVSFS